MQNDKLDKTLEELRNPQLGGAIDLTGPNVQQLKNKKAKRILKAVLKKYLPRRQKGIEHSSTIGNSDSSYYDQPTLQ